MSFYNRIRAPLGVPARNEFEMASGFSTYNLPRAFRDATAQPVRTVAGRIPRNGFLQAASNWTGFSMSIRHQLPRSL